MNLTVVNIFGLHYFEMKKKGLHRLDTVKRGLNYSEIKI